MCVPESIGYVLFPKNIGHELRAAEPLRKLWVWGSVEIVSIVVYSRSAVHLVCSGLEAGSARSRGSGYDVSQCVDS